MASTALELREVEVDIPESLQTMAITTPRKASGCADKHCYRGDGAPPHVTRAGVALDGHETTLARRLAVLQPDRVIL